MLHKETTASSTLTRPLRRIGSAGAALGIILGTALGAALPLGALSPGALPLGVPAASATDFHHTRVTDPALEHVEWRYPGPAGGSFSGGSLEFSHGTVTGDDSCNRIVGKYTITHTSTGNILSFSSVGITRRYCQYGHATQRAFSAMLARPNTYTIVKHSVGGTYLTLSPAGSTGILPHGTMVFTKRS